MARRGRPPTSRPNRSRSTSRHPRTTPTPLVCFYGSSSRAERPRFSRAILSPSKPHSRLWRKRKLEPIETLRADIAPELARAINAALAPTPEQRIVTCAEMARTIRKVLHLPTGKAELRECVNDALGAATAESRKTRGDESALAEILAADQLFAVQSAEIAGFSDPARLNGGYDG